MWVPKPYIPPHKRLELEAGLPVSRNSIEFISFVADKLDSIAEAKEVKTSYLLDHCDICYDRKTGLFDEAKLQFVPGNLRKLLQIPSNIRIIPGDFRVNPKLREIVGRCSYGAYELRQLIVRSGVYHNDQLAGLRFTEHELSVNAASFLAARSEYVECSCNGHGYGLMSRDRMMEDTPYIVSLGDPNMDPDLYQAIQESLKDSPSFREETDNSALTKVEEAFIKGKHIPTGRRVRSKAKILERKAANPRSPSPHLIVECYPRVPRDFIVEDPYLFPQQGKTVTLKFPQIKILRKNARRRPPKPRVIVGRHLPPKAASKYWYFLRTRNKWNYSLHHPLPGDPLPVREDSLLP